MTLNSGSLNNSINSRQKFSSSPRSIDSKKDPRSSPERTAFVVRSNNFCRSKNYGLGLNMSLAPWWWCFASFLSASNICTESPTNRIFSATLIGMYEGIFSGFRKYWICPPVPSASLSFCSEQQKEHLLPYCAVCQRDQQWGPWEWAHKCTHCSDTRRHEDTATRMFSLQKSSHRMTAVFATISLRLIWHFFRNTTKQVLRIRCIASSFCHCNRSENLHQRLSTRKSWTTNRTVLHFWWRSHFGRLAELHPGGGINGRWRPNCVWKKVIHQRSGIRVVRMSVTCYISHHDEKHLPSDVVRADLRFQPVLIHHLRKLQSKLLSIVELFEQRIHCTCRSAFREASKPLAVCTGPHDTRVKSCNVKKTENRWNAIVRRQNGSVSAKKNQCFIRVPLHGVLHDRYSIQGRFVQNFQNNASMDLNNREHNLECQRRWNLVRWHPDGILNVHVIWDSLTFIHNASSCENGS